MARVSGAINGVGAQGSDGPGHNDAAAVVLLEVVEQLTVGGHSQGQVDPVAEGSGGNGGIEALEAASEVAERTGKELPRMLAFGGTTVNTFAVSGYIVSPKHLAAHKFLLASYFMALFLLLLFGEALVVMSVWVSGDPLRRAAASKMVMWATLVPLLLVLWLGTLGTN